MSVSPLFMQERPKILSSAWANVPSNCPHSPSKTQSDRSSSLMSAKADDRAQNIEPAAKLICSASKLKPDFAQSQFRCFTLADKLCFSRQSSNRGNHSNIFRHYGFFSIFNNVVYRILNLSFASSIRLRLLCSFPINSYFDNKP